MFTRIDHVMICVPDLPRGIEQYNKPGFNIYPGGAHAGKDTHNAIAFLRDDYIELLAIRDRAGHQAASGPRNPGTGLADFIAAGGGIRYIVLQSDNLAMDVAAMRKRGVDVSDAIEGGRRTPAGQELRRKAAAMYANVLGIPQPPMRWSAAAPVRSRRCTAPPAWAPPPAGCGSTACRLSRVACATPANRQCWQRPPTLVARTSGSWDRSKRLEKSRSMRWRRSFCCKRMPTR